MAVTLTTSRMGLSAQAAFTASPAVTHAQLHTGDPGGAGTGNVAAGVSRAAVTVGSPSGGAVTVTATFTIPAAGGPYTHVSYWTASTGGTFCGTDDFAPDTTFANSGTLGHTLTWTA